MSCAWTWRPLYALLKACVGRHRGGGRATHGGRLTPRLPARTAAHQAALRPAAAAAGHRRRAATEVGTRLSSRVFSGADQYLQHTVYNLLQPYQLMWHGINSYVISFDAGLTAGVAVALMRTFRSSA